METITLTFGDCAENHRGMQSIGEMGHRGLSLAELEQTRDWYVSHKKVCEMVDLRQLLPPGLVEHADPAYLLIVRDGCSAIVDPGVVLAEQTSLHWDTKAFMYGRVVTKHARHNLCYSDFAQAPNYEAGMGTVVPFAQLPELSKLRLAFGEITKLLANLQCEGNRYYDIRKTYIGFHGDTERKIVVAVRLGADFPIHYQWYQTSEPIGTRFTATLKHGDVYYMSEKAVGFDWKRRNTLTLRHAAGFESNVVKKK